MHSYSIKDLWDLPEIKITATNKISHQIFIDVMPTKSKQACPICASENTSRRGIGYVRKVRHFEAFGWPVYLNLPAIRKGHTYNTGLHDLRGGTFLDVIPGRKMEELQAYFNTQSTLCALKPVTIIMDLAKAYHTFAKKDLKQHFRILGKRRGQLKNDEKTILHRLLQYAAL